VTIVKGTAAYHDAAAKRLADILKPWGIQAKIVAAADVNKPREVAQDEAPTFAGIEPTGHGQIIAGRGNSPEVVGYDLEGATILLGSPDDNPLIHTLVKRNVLPYAVGTDFPGRNRGMIAWQLDIIRPGEESIALIATDAAGLEEAVGSTYEAAAGMEPLTPWELPSRSIIAPASHPDTGVRAMNIAWQAILPDRADSIIAQADGSILAKSLDGSLTTISPTGQIVGQRPSKKEDDDAKKPSNDVKDIAADKLIPHRIVKWMATDGDRKAIAYWGGTLQILDGHNAVIFQQLLPQDIATLAWSGGNLVVALADGRLLAFDASLPQPAR
jgi:hypothetical protein